MIEFIKYSLIDKDFIADESRQCLSLVTYEQLKEIEGLLDLNPERTEDIFDEEGCRFESHDGFDFLSIQVMDARQPLAKKQHVCMYLRRNLLLFIGDYGEYLSDAIEKIKESKMNDMGIDDVLYYILDIIIEDDFDELETMEDKLAELEEAIVTGKKHKCMREIIGYRRDLLEMKKFYQQMYIVCSQILENENGIIGEETVRYFKNLRSKLDRLVNMVLSLRDYVSQVLDAYQSQVDISQNNIMKFFTVITSIFMPLTLITGWYGMNLTMPEYDWEYSYFCVIILSVVMVSSLIVYFKKKHWF